MLVVGHIEGLDCGYTEQMFNGNLKISEMNTIVMHGDLISYVLYRSSILSEFSLNTQS